MCTDLRDEGNGPPEPGCYQSLRVKDWLVKWSRRWGAKGPPSRGVGDLNDWRTMASLVWAAVVFVVGVAACWWAVSHQPRPTDAWILLAAFSVGYFAVFAAVSWAVAVYQEAAGLRQLTERVTGQLKNEHPCTDADLARRLWAYRAYLIEVRSRRQANRGTLWMSLATIGVPVVINVFKLNKVANLSRLSSGEFAVAFTVGFVFVGLWVGMAVRRYAQQWMASDFWEGVWWHLPLDP